MNEKRYTLLGVIVIICWLLVACNSSANKRISANPTNPIVKSQEQEDNSSIIVKENIVIDNRDYKYLEYEKISTENIRIRYIISSEKELVVPAKIDEYSVEELGKDSENDIEEQYVNISKGTKYNKVIIEEGIKTIKENAFYDMNVSEVVLPKSLICIEDNAFGGNNYCTIKKINLGSVEEIGDCAFFGCKKLRKICLKKENISIGSSAFAYCSSLSKIELPNEFNGRLGGSCFEETGIEVLRWPCISKDVENSIGTSVFSHCKKLKKVVFPKNQKHIYIGKGMFTGCKKLNKLVFSKGTGLVTYKSSPCSENYMNGVTTLEFRDKNTKVRGNRYRGKDNKWRYDFITVNKIIAPKKSKAALYASKAMCIKKFTKKALKGLKRDDSARDYSPDDAKSTTYFLAPIRIGRLKLEEV